jgi:dual specificity MAP kinase phosphatase
VPTCPNLHKNAFDYHTASSSPPPLDECAAFMERVRGEGGKVLVHCMSGTSRAPAVALYYLMRAAGMRLDAAYALLKAKRPSVSFHEADAARVQQAEAEVFGAGASGFRVPLGKQPPQPPPPQQQQQIEQPGGSPFGWAAQPGALPGGGFAFGR